MMSPDDVVVPMQSAVAEYFSGERREMVLIIAGSLIFTILAAWLWVATRSGFAMSFAVTVLSAAILLSITAGSLLVRDKELSSVITEGIESPNMLSMLKTERERISILQSKYRYYRFGAALIAAFCVLGLMLSDRSWLHGVAAGLLLLVVAQILIDHFSERRAGVYINRLSVTETATTH